MKYRLNEKTAVYSAPTSTSPVVAELKAGDELEVGEVVKYGDENWNDVTLPDGKMGYIAMKPVAANDYPQEQNPPSQSMTPSFQQPSPLPPAAQPVTPQMAKESDRVNVTLFAIAGGGVCFVLVLLAGGGGAKDGMQAGAIGGFLGAIVASVINGIPRKKQ
jgi:hypothetical protein